MTQVSQVSTCQAVFQLNVACSGVCLFFRLWSCPRNKGLPGKPATSWFHGLIERREILLACLPFLCCKWELGAPLGKDAESWQARLEYSLVDPENYTKQLGGTSCHQTPTGKWQSVTRELMAFQPRRYNSELCYHKGEVRGKVSCPLPQEGWVGGVKPEGK